MTAQEFSGPFQLLCRGLECNPTSEQMGAWYRRLERVTFATWKASVDELLFDGKKGYLPKLEHVLTVVEREGERLRQAAVQQDKPRAQKTYVLLKSDDVNAEPTAPYQTTPMFRCIQLKAERSWLQRKGLNPKKTQLLTEDGVRKRIEAIGVELAKLEPLLTDTEARDLVDKFENKEVA